LGANGDLAGKSYEAELVNDGSQEGPDNLSEEIPVKLSGPLEAIGSLPVFWVSLPCMVIVEGWPAWLPILPSLGAKVVALIGQPRFEEENMEGVAKLEVGSEGANRFQVLNDMLIFVLGSSVFMHDLAGDSQKDMGGIGAGFGKLSHCNDLLPLP
jgi:hypothetical protein